MTIQQAEIIYPLTRTKGQAKQGSPAGHHRPKDTYNGIYFLHGLGCKEWHDCFSCPKKKCNWQSGKAQPDPK